MPREQGEGEKEPDLLDARKKGVSKEEEQEERQMIYLGIIAGIFGLDYFIKRYVDKNRELMEETPILKGKVIIRKYYNKGAALNFLAKKPERMRQIQTLLMAAAGGSFFTLLSRRGDKGVKTALAMILGGGASNLYDRVKKGHVVDYFSFKTRSRRLSGIIFNVSDFFVFAGALLLVLFGKKEK